MTHWSTRRLAREVAMSETTVWRIWHSVNLKPHRTETFKYSRDPDLVAKVRDVVGLYLAPPERAIVLSVDEKTQIGALDRTAPMLPLKPGQVERHTHDYKRNGTTCLFAALEVGTGRVTGQTRARHTGDDFLAFLRHVEDAYPAGELHVVLDNVSTHKTPAVQNWLAARPRITFHFTPTSASWMNQIETWFGILSAGRSVAELSARSRSSSPGSTPSPRSGTPAPHPSRGSSPPTRSSPRPFASGQRSANRDTSSASWADP